MYENYDFFQVVSVPDKPFDKGMLLEIMGAGRFIIIYDVARRATLFGIDHASSAATAQQVESALPGVSLERLEGERFDDSKCTALSLYRRLEASDNPILSDLFDLQIGSGRIAVEFVSMRMDEARAGKAYLEGVLSKREAGHTSSFLSGAINKRANMAIHTENFRNSEEQLFLTETLESLNASILKNGIAYNVYFLVEGSSLERYVNSRFLVFSRRGPGSQRPRALPFGANTVKSFLNVYGARSISHVVFTADVSSSGNIVVGTQMRDSVFDTREGVMIDITSLNLGTLITGLPGSGKTSEAMALLSQVSRSSNTMVCVISPTDEWNAFAASHGYKHIILCDGRTPINFFRCPGPASAEKFYEDLAMVLSSASNAGPYRNPMEKCMLNAFRKEYSETREPDPVALYEAIAKSIAGFHARSTPTGYKYTKHGENIRSALENLRAIIARPEYSGKGGLRFEELLSTGAVFDMSRVSNSSKPYFYALILSQLYSIASTFNTNGDDELRLLICMEESQIMFRDKDSPVIQDIRARIQDFRKLGVGLMLLAHNVTDIETTVRRLCQTKLYLKQAPDVAPIAAKELVFTYAKEEDVAQRLKHLDSRVGALSYVEKMGSEKLARDTVFIRTNDYREGAAAPAQAQETEAIKPIYINATIAIEAVLSESEQQREIILSMRKIRVLFLGEVVAEGDIAHGAFPEISGLLKGREYLIEVLDKRSRAIYSTRAIADHVIRVNIN